MKKVDLLELERYLNNIFLELGLYSENARIVTNVFMDATKRNVGHHDIYDLPYRIRAIQNKTVQLNTTLPLVKSYGAIQQRDGENTLGELSCKIAMEKAMGLADEFGIGICACRNTNHFLCGEVYTRNAAKKGYISMILAKSAVNMGMKEAKHNCMSTLPIACAYPTSSGVMGWDFCMAYTSVGQLVKAIREEREVNHWWGIDSDGKYCNNPEDIYNSGMRMPIGEHKGFALSMLGEVLTGVLSEGSIMDEKKADTQYTSDISHTVMAIKADAYMSLDSFKESAEKIAERAKVLSGVDLRMPGERTQRNIREIEHQGYIELEHGIIDELNKYTELYGIEPL